MSESDLFEPTMTLAYSEVDEEILIDALEERQAKAKAWGNHEDVIAIDSMLFRLRNRVPND